MKHLDAIRRNAKNWRERLRAYGGGMIIDTLEVEVNLIGAGSKLGLKILAIMARLLGIRLRPDDGMASVEYVTMLASEGIPVFSQVASMLKLSVQEVKTGLEKRQISEATIARAIGLYINSKIVKS